MMKRVASDGLQCIHVVHRQVEVLSWEEDASVAIENLR